MGHDVDEFVDSPHEDLVCIICSDVMDTPFSTPCDHHFCEACLKQALATTPACPTCRRACRASHIKPSARPIRNLVGSLRVRCPNTAKGCDAVVALEDVPTHKATECVAEEAQCEVDGCAFRALRGDKEAWARHEEGEGAVRHVRLLAHAVGVLKADKAAQAKRCERLEKGLEAATAALHEQRGERERLAEAVRRQGGHITSLQRAKTTTNKALEGVHNATLRQGRQVEEVQRAQQQHAPQLLHLTERSVFLASRLAVHNSPTTVTWVLGNMHERRASDARVLSPVLSFSNVPDPSKRYRFRLKLYPNGSHKHGTQGAVDLSFVPLPGAPADVLEWPMQTPVEVVVVNHSGGESKTMVLDPRAGSASEFFDKHAPPVEGNTEGRGWPRFLSDDEFGSGDFVKDTCLVVQVSLRLGHPTRGRDRDSVKSVGGGGGVNNNHHKSRVWRPHSPSQRLSFSAKRPQSPSP